MSSDDTPDTTVLHVRHIPADLHKRARVRALEDGVTLRELVVAALERYLAEDDAP